MRTLTLILGALLLGACSTDNDDPDAVVLIPEPTPTVAVIPPPAETDGQAVKLSAIAANPQEYAGDTVQMGAEVNVTEVPTDRGFWIESEGQRYFALVIDQPAEEPIDINPGQKLRIAQATVRTPDMVGEVKGEPLDADTRKIIEGQQVFFVIDEEQITIVERGSG